MGKLRQRTRWSFRRVSPQHSADSDDASNGDPTAGTTDDEIPAYNAERKMKQKENFDEEFDKDKKLAGSAVGENDTWML
jgi:hypothetical protein